MATAMAVMTGTAYLEKKQFLDNFWEDWRPVLGKNHTIKSLSKCDFTPIHEWHMAERERKKALSKEVCTSLSSPPSTEAACLYCSLKSGTMHSKWLASRLRYMLMQQGPPIAVLYSMSEEDLEKQAYAIVTRMTIAYAMHHKCHIRIALKVSAECMVYPLSPSCSQQLSGAVCQERLPGIELMCG